MQYDTQRIRNLLEAGVPPRTIKDNTIFPLNVIMEEYEKVKAEKKKRREDLYGKDFY